MNNIKLGDCITIEIETNFKILSDNMQNRYRISIFGVF